MNFHQKLLTASVLSLFGVLGGALLARSLIDTAEGQRPSSSSELADGLLTRANNAVRDVQLANGNRLTLGQDGRTLSVIDAETGKSFKTFQLANSRFHASMATLPSGRVLIWGGISSTGALYGDGLWFDSRTMAVTEAAYVGLAPRAGHTATVLTDGALLIAGGISKNRRLKETSELWYEDGRSTTALPPHLSIARVHHQAELRVDGGVKIRGGLDGARRPVAKDTVLYPLAEKTVADGVARDEVRNFTVASTLPKHNATGVMPSSVVALRFTQPVDATKLRQGSVALIGPGGIAAIDVSSVEGGRLLFIRPRQPLFPESKYVVAASRLKNLTGSTLPLSTLEFETAALDEKARVSSSEPGQERSRGIGCDGYDRIEPCSAHGRVEDGVWTPGRDNTGGRWRLYTKAYRVAPNPALERSLRGSDRTVLSGRVAQIDEKPVAGISVHLGDKTAVTNDAGEFILYDIPGGRQELYVDGSTANRADAEYGQFIAGVDVPNKRYTQLPYTMYVPKISARDKVNIRSPLAKDTVLTHPAMPGLEVLIPAGTVIRDRKGKLVTEIALVPTPVNRAPFPVTENFPMYFTIEPGGAAIQGLTPEAAKGIRVSYPNYGSNKPARSSFWIYDPANGWQVYGQGALSRDGSRFIAENGVALHRMTGGAYTVNMDDPAPEPDLPEDGDECGCSGSGGVANAGDPIDLKTGVFTRSITDIAIRDVMPISLGRTYRTHDSRNRAFGIGTTSNYGYSLYTTLGGDYKKLQLVLPNGAGLEFDRIGPPSSISSWRHSGSTGDFSGSVIKTIVNDPVDGKGYRLTKLDGTVFFFETGDSRLRYIQNKYGHQIRFIYSAGLLTRIVSPNERYIDLNYDSDNRISTAVDHTGRTWAYTYSAQGMLTRVTYPDTTHEDIAYDTESVTLPEEESILIHRITSITNRRGFRELLNAYESVLDVGMPGAYRVIKQTLADNSEINIQYEHFNGANYGVLVTEADGSQRRVVFDTWRYPASESLGYGTPLEQTYQFERDPVSQRLTARVDPMGRRTEYTYDANGFVSQVVSLAGTQDAVETGFTYNVEGQITSVTDPLSQQTTFDYLGRCLREATDPLGHSTTVKCNGDGLPESITNALGKTTHLYYSGGQMVASVDALNRATGYAYDSLGRVVVARDQHGQIWRRYYDSNDRMIKAVDPLGYETEYAYDGNGNVAAVLKAHGNGVTYVYDARDRLFSRTDSLGQVESWTYDAMGRVSSHTDRKGQLTLFNYDVLGRLATRTYHDGTVATYSYDVGNRLTELSDTGANVLTWDYDQFDRVVSEVGPQGSVSYGYDAGGRRIYMNVASQPQVVYGYDAASRLTSIQQGSEVVVNDYDHANRLAQTTLPNGVKTGYAYNDANQLTGIAYIKSDTTLLGDIGYGYSSTGRLIVQTGSLAPNLLPSAASASSTFDDNHRQTGWNGQALSYDANGNMTSDGNRTFHWNARNQLVQVSQGGIAIATFAYDAVGRRIGKVEGGTTISYLYDGLNVAQEMDGGTVNPILNGLAIDQRYARNDAVGRTYYLTDALGSTRALTNSAGSMIQRYDYTPYGQSIQTSATFSNPYLYIGRELDKSGLYYLRARYYNAGMGRFIAEDPIGLAGGLNTYSYVRGNPVSSVDPFGLVEVLMIPEGDYGAIYDGMALIKSRPGELTVGIHHDGSTFIGPDGKDWSVEQVADYVKKNADLSNYKAITLYSCRTASSQNGNPPPAQLLSNLLPLPVQAPTEYTWTTDDPRAPFQGNYGKKPDGTIDRGKKGEWIYFSKGRPR